MKAVRFWISPRRLLDEGTSPDYRYSLANERTFLAWIRTALALAGAGLAVHQLLPDLREAMRVGLELALLAMGAACALRGMNHWARSERAMRQGADLPVSGFLPLLSAGVGAASAAVAWHLLAGWTART